MGMISSWISPKARKGVEGGIAGRGLFATEPIGVGEVVAVKGGQIMTTQDMHALSAPLPNSEIQIAYGLHLVARAPEEYEAVMLFINHFLRAQRWLRRQHRPRQMRAVASGEELSTDYAMFDDYAGHMTCRCGTSSCRRTIDGQDWRRPELQQRYHGYFSWHLQRKIDAD